MLFAAGFGTRMGTLTRERPKPLIPVAGRALLDHALALAAHVPTRVVNAHYHADQIAAHLGGTDVDVSIEAPQILDTGGGLRHALPRLGGGPVYTLNTDAVWRGPNPLKLLEAAWAPERMDALMLCVPLERAVGRHGGGDFTLGPEGDLTRPGPIVYTGAQIIKTDTLAQVCETAFSLTVLWAEMARTQRLKGLAYPGHWADVGHPEGIKQAEAMLDG
ncbi:nucleotidyltransferase family protein [Cognatishimia sp. F0-27]|nr:nucleotidyltransferase family protein [Cognatishimia sp. F0-27]